jgi:hypothetical protein
MLFFVELDHVKTTAHHTGGRSRVHRTGIFPTLARPAVSLAGR